MLVLLLLFGLGVHVTFGIEFKVPAFDRRPKYLELYDFKTDAFLRSKLVDDDFKVVVETELVPSTSFHSFRIESQLDYLDVMQLGGAAELNLAVGFLSGRIAASVDVRSELKGERKSFVHIIKYTKKSKTERVDPCAKGMVDAVYDDLLESSGNPGSFVVVGAVFGVELEVHVKVTMTSSARQSSLDAEVSAEIASMVNSLKTTGSIQKSEQKIESSQEVSVSVRTKHVFPPFSQPQNFSDVPRYLDEATKFIGNDSVVGSVLEYIVEEIGSLQHCLKGRFVESQENLRKSELVVGRLRQTSREVDDQDYENRQLHTEFQKSRYCFSASEAVVIMTAKSSADVSIGRLRAEMARTVTEYRAGTMNLWTALASLDNVLLSSSKYSLDSYLVPDLFQKLQFVVTMTGYKVQCFRRNWNPLLMSSSSLGKELRYYPFTQASLTSMLATQVPRDVGKHCLDPEVMCYLINCDLGFSFCQKMTSRGYYNEWHIANLLSGKAYSVG